MIAGAGRAVKSNGRSSANHRAKLQRYKAQRILQIQEDKKKDEEKSIIRQKVGSFVENSRVQLAILILIIVNSIFMGIGTFDFVTDNPDILNIFEIIDLVFLVIFTLELGLHVISQGYRLFLDGWLFFDFIIVMISWVNSFLNGANLQVMRAFRIFRALRLITRIKVMKQMVSAILDTVPSMTAVLLLLIIIIYIYSVLCTQLFKDLPEKYADKIDQNLSTHFRTLNDSLLTLFQMMTADGWADICREIMRFEPWAWLPFISYVIVTSSVVTNLIIAVICDSIHNYTIKAEAEKMDKDNKNDVMINNEDDDDSNDCDNNSNASRIQAMTETIEKLHDEQRMMIESIVLITSQLKSRREGEEKRHSVNFKISEFDNVTFNDTLQEEVSTSDR